MLEADKLTAESSWLAASGSKPVLSDATILKHIARQSKRQAGYKQLVRELGLHGDQRR